MDGSLALNWAALALVVAMVTAGILVALWINRCKCDWEPVVERELPSVAEIVGKEDLSRWPSPAMTYKAAFKKFFAIISCKKCGAVKKFETWNAIHP